jgi:hypothetical protein
LLNPKVALIREKASSNNSAKKQRETEASPEGRPCRLQSQTRLRK